MGLTPSYYIEGDEPLATKKRTMENFEPLEVENKAQEAVRKSLVQINEAVLGTDVINWTMPCKDGSGTVCLFMILKWQKNRETQEFRPKPGWTVMTLIDAEGRVVDTELK